MSLVLINPANNMNKIITWTTPRYSGNPIADETDSLFFADDVIRHLRFTSPVSIKFCLSESIRYVVDNQQITVPPDGFYLANAGLEMECLPNKPGVKALLIYFTNELIRDVYDNTIQHEKLLLDHPFRGSVAPNFFQHIYRSPTLLSGQIRVLAHQMSQSKTSNYTLTPDIFYNLAESLLALQKDISRQIGLVNARMHSTREELFRRVFDAKAFMQDQWQADLTLHEIARHACLSPYHFHRSFREAFGLSPMKWFRQLKLENAKKMLAGKKMTVTEVALTCGFADVFSFSKAFKREWGLNPSEVQN